MSFFKKNRLNYHYNNLVYSGKFFIINNNVINTNTTESLATNFKNNKKLINSPFNK